MKNEKRKDYLSWDEYFIAITELSAMRSKDPSTRVGACIVSNDNRILSIGYNGAPNGFDDDEFPWNREGKNLETKYPYVCHAELNAILNYRGYKIICTDDELEELYKSGVQNAFITIGYMGNSNLREKLYYKLKTHQINVPLKHSNNKLTSPSSLK